MTSKPTATTSGSTAAINTSTAVALFSVILILLYLPSLSTPPFLDDIFHFFIFDETSAGQLPYLLNPACGFPFIRPAYYFTLWAERKIFASSMVGYRLTAIFLHVLSGLIIVYLSKHLFQIEHKTSRILMFLWLVYPAHPKVLLYPSCLTDSLFWLFSTATLAAYLRYRLTQTRFVRYGAAALLLFTLALLSKETAVTLPLLILPTEYLVRFRETDVRQKSFRFLNPIHIAMWLTAGLYVWYRFLIYNSFGGYAGVMFLPRSVHEAFRLLCSMFILIPGQIICPLALENTTAQTALVMLSAGLFYGLVFHLLVKEKVSRPVVLFCLFEIAVVMLPVLPVISSSYLDYIVPRYLYASGWGIGLLMVLWIRNRRFSRWVIGLILVVWLPTTAYNQWTFHKAGVVSETVSKNLERYCGELRSGKRIIVIGIPQKIGAINIEHYSDVLSVFNLEAHRRCRLAPSYPVERGVGIETISAYMNSLPGRVSTRPPASPERLRQLTREYDIILLVYRPDTARLERISPGSQETFDGHGEPPDRRR